MHHQTTLFRAHKACSLLLALDMHSMSQSLFLSSYRFEGIALDDEKHSAGATIGVGLASVAIRVQCPTPC